MNTLYLGAKLMYTILALTVLAFPLHVPCEGAGERRAARQASDVPSQGPTDVTDNPTGSNSTLSSLPSFSNESDALADPSMATALTQSIASASTCSRVFVDVAVYREGCSPGFMRVPVCRGTCNSYTRYQKAFPYFRAECSCCKAVLAEPSKRTVRFQCGGNDVDVAYRIAAIKECSCSPCGSRAQVPKGSNPN